MENPYAAPTQFEYNPGRVSWGQFLSATAIVMISASVLALMLHLAFNAGAYFVVLAPAVAALILSE